MLCDLDLLHPEPRPCGRPLLTHTSARDTQTLKGRSGSVSVGSLGPGLHNVLFEPSKNLWWKWDLTLNLIFPLLPSCWGSSFALEHGIYIYILWDPTFSLSMVVQQWVVILEFSQKMSSQPCSLPSCRDYTLYVINISRLYFLILSLPQSLKVTTK